VAKWEYVVEAYESGVEELQAVLNQRADEGWELAALLPPGSMTHSHQTMQEAMGQTPSMLHLVLKRPRS
jgi:hypothetical protein